MKAELSCQPGLRSCPLCSCRGEEPAARASGGEGGSLRFLSAAVELDLLVWLLAYISRS